MFPPSLQKNIQELDRQISLLETECENMESDTKEYAVCVKEAPKEPFITGPVFNSSSFFKTSVTPRTYSPNGSFIKPGRMHSIGPDNSESYDLKKLGERSLTIREKEMRDQISRKSVNSITEISESSIENYKLNPKSIPAGKYVKGSTWSDIFYRQTLSSRELDGKSKISKEELKPKSARKKSESEKYLKLLPAEKSSSDEEPTKELISNELEDRILNQNEHSLSSDRNSTKKRRRRSTRTKKNSIDELPVDMNMNKLWNEKKIQCMLWNEEKEKAQFLVNLHDSIRTLHLLIGDLRAKPSQDKTDEVLNDMQNTLLKITGIKSMNALNDPISLFANFKKEKMRIVEGEEMEVSQFRKALLGVKKFCEELTDEKSTLSEELSAKNQTITNLKNKEKEYLSLISSLKFNLEKIKQDADESIRIKKSLMLVKNKLQEEVKVVEALKRSHGKMQRLVENYVLENDKLRTQLKIAELESQKFNVLLTGREEEVKKYKEEIELFQKQISQQLNILRSKAAIEAMKVIDNETNIFSKSESYIETSPKVKDQSQSLSLKTFEELRNEMNLKKATMPRQQTAESLGVLASDKAELKKDFHQELNTQSCCDQLRTNIEEILEDMKTQHSDVSHFTPPSTSSEEV